MQGFRAPDTKYPASGELYIYPLYIYRNTDGGQISYNYCRVLLGSIAAVQHVLVILDWD